MIAMAPLLTTTHGTRIDLPVHRWRGGCATGEAALLAGLPDPVLDVGCGPGRLVAALAAAARPALGIDTSPIAVAEARRRGAPVLRRSVFERLPGEGRWGAVLLLDGNVGIGGDAVALLARAARLLRAGGTVLAEVEAPGRPSEALTVRIEAAGGAAGPWFPWATVGADGVAAVARAAGLSLAALEQWDDRWFARVAG